MAAVLEHRYENQSIYHFEGGYTDELEDELIQARPKHDDIKDALASVIEIAIKPRKSRTSSDFGGFDDNIIPIHSKFGGVSF